MAVAESLFIKLQITSSSPLPLTLPHLASLYPISFWLRVRAGSVMSVSGLFHKQITGAAVLGVKVKATVKESADGEFVLRTVDRSRLWEVQTPQVGGFD